MSKFVNVPNGDYKITVQDDGTITFDTGLGRGKVVITGDLYVEGATTFLNTTNTEIEDNILLLNSGDTGNGITGNTSGIRINRGTLVDAQILFDENITWTDPVTEQSISGAFTFKTVTNSILGIQTNSITTGGGDLYLINSGTGVISVTGTNNYEDNVTDDDHIPNKKYVIDYVDTTLASTFQSRISEGTTSPTFVEASDVEVSGIDSVVEIGIDNTVVSSFYADRIELGDIRIQGTSIETVSSNEDLRIVANGTGSVVFDDNIVLNKTPGQDDATTDPSAPSDGVKLYSKTQGPGKTGLYFINEDAVQDEIISNNRAVLYGMIF